MAYGTSSNKNLRADYSGIQYFAALIPRLRRYALVLTGERLVADRSVAGQAGACSTAPESRLPAAQSASFSGPF
jgi:hypothetical protein